MNRKKLGYPPSPENHWLVGPVKPINVGLRNVTGSWIARIDDDDEWLPEHLENSLRHAKNFNVEFISSSYKVIEKGIIKKIDPSGDPPIGGVQTWVYRSYLSFFRAHISCWRKSWNRVNDTDIAQRMRNAGVRIATHDSVGAIIKPRNESEQVGSRAYLQNPDFYSSFYDLPRPKP
jgi:glycosyltransferase involved in cell wall biosynthesis